MTENDFIHDLSNKLLVMDFAVVKATKALGDEVSIDTDLLKNKLETLRLKVDEIKELIATRKYEIEKSS